MQPVIAGSPDALTGATHLVLPGVGSFGDCMAQVERRGLVSAIRDWVAAGKPYLGICLGYQILFDSSEESPGVAGLGIVPGTVRRFKQTPGLKIPHMGWNDVTPRKNHPLIEQGEAYYLHGYQFDVVDSSEILATTEHGIPLVSAVGRDNIIGVQFHPEKSQAYGLAFLKRFLEWKP